jgi:HK97 family phage portal protein
MGRKASEARQVMVMNQIGRPVNTPKNYEAYSAEGYQANVIGYKCVSILSRACASIDWELYKGDREIESHPILDLLTHPNPMQSRAAFFESFIAYYMIDGNSYMEAIRPSGKGPPVELWSIRPDKMRIIGGSLGLPQAFVFKYGQNEKLWPVDQITGLSDILHMKTFHPTDAWYGMSPIEAATYSIDQHNDSGKWNLSLLQNMGTPSGALVVEQSDSNPSGIIPAEQFKNLQDQIKNKVAGAGNAGKVMLLEGGMKWQAMGFNAKDMDWMEGRNNAARDIALAFGVPPIILGIKGDSTFANYKEARASLYEDTILPLLDLISDELNSWLIPMYGDQGLELYYDHDSIAALDVRRSEKFAEISGAGFLTTNEKRELLGFDSIDGGDTILVNAGQISIADIGMLPDESDALNPDKKPVENEDGKTENDAEDGDKSNHKFTQINLLNRNEKQKSAKDANILRERLASGMYHDLKEAFENQAKELKKALENVEPRTMEFAALQVLSDTKEMELILKKYIRRSLKLFGEPILNGAKCWGLEFETKSSIKFQTFVDRFVESRTIKSLAHIEGTSGKKARRIIKEAIAEAQETGASSRDIASQLEDEFGSISTSRANTIARTEMAIASNQGSLEAAKALDIPDLMKEWVSVNDDRTRGTADADHVSVNGQQVPLNEKFSVNPDASMDGPGDPSAPAEQVINCRCSVVYARAGKTLIPQYEVK